MAPEGPAERDTVGAPGVEGRALPIEEPHGLPPPALHGLWVGHTSQGAGGQKEGGTPLAAGPTVRLSSTTLRLGKAVTVKPYQGKGRKRAPYQDQTARTTIGRM